MRELTIIRYKTGVGCLGKFKYYVEDPMGDTKVNGIQCRLLGILKNGQQNTFWIPESACRIAVINGKTSQGFCSEWIQLPEGAEPICIAGKARYDLARGNCFRFEGNDVPEVKAHRRKQRIRGFGILLVAAILGFAVGFFSTYHPQGPDAEPEPKAFTCENMSITLTDAFRNAEYPNFTGCFESRQVAIFCLQEKFSLVEGFENYSVEQYAGLVIDASSPTTAGAQVTKRDGLTYFEYTADNAETGETYIYCTYCFKTDDSFWTVQFTTLLENQDIYRDVFLDWAKTVSFSASA